MNANPSALNASGSNTANENARSSAGLWASRGMTASSDVKTDEAPTVQIKKYIVQMKKNMKYQTKQ
jgi:hypothetical protein